LPTIFRERGQALEAKYAHDEEFRFRANARRDKLFARWLATTLRLSDDASAGLMAAVLAIPDGPGHDEAILRHAAELASDHGVPSLENGLAAALERCALRALKELADWRSDLAAELRAR